MDANELIKQAPELIKGGAALAGALKFTDIVKAMLGPAADELAEMWRDQVRMYRYERQLRCVEKAEKMAEAAGLIPGAVPPKILFPLLEGASFEEDEDLHSMWAALLSNAAAPKSRGKVRPGFIAILRQMSADEAVVLKFIADRESETGSLRTSYAPACWKNAENPPNIEFSTLLICLDGLEAAQLIRRTVVIKHNHLQLERDGETHLDDEGPYNLTDRGRSFIEACSPPKRVSA